MPTEALSAYGNYRASHQAAGCGSRYELTYQAGYYAALWNKIERPLLEGILQRVGGPGRKCLDFACGTGRIAGVAAQFFDTVTGVDISESMLANAVSPANVKLQRGDITKVPLDEKFDVATGFRFFLNAEDSLKRDALLAIHRHLNDGGWLICDIHVNANSPLGLVTRVLNRIRPAWRQNVISRRQFARFLKESGFEIVGTEAYGYLPRPGHFLPGFCEIMVEPVEIACRKLRIPGQLAQGFIVVSRKRPLPYPGKTRA